VVGVIRPWWYEPSGVVVAVRIARAVRRRGLGADRVVGGMDVSFRGGRDEHLGVFPGIDGGEGSPRGEA
jgi:hypothetical protein